MQIEQLGPYRITRQLGRGGMGTVYEAIDQSTGELAAIKVLAARLNQDEAFRERFAAEIESLRKLRHPNIVRILAYGEEEGYQFFAMELVAGRSLEEEVQTGRTFEWRQVIDVGVQVCRALKHAHDRGIIHRDIKPANLLSTPQGLVKLSDFGIAKLFGNTGMTSDGGVIGTAEYMAPEQADGRPVSHRCDLYSLGGVMYTLLAGRPPFASKSLVEMLQLQRFADPDPVRRYAPETPEPLSELIAQLLSKDPDERVANALVLSRRLEAMLHGLSARAEAEGGSRSTSESAGAAAMAPSAADERPGETSDLPYPFIEGPPSGLAATAAGVSGDVSDSQPHASDAQPGGHFSDVTLATDEAEYAIADAPPRPAGSLRLAAPTDTDAKKSPLPHAAGNAVGRATTGTGVAGSGVRRFTVVDDDEHRRLEAIDEEAPPAWISAQTWVLVAALLCVGLTAWWLLQPPSADSLYERIAAAAAEGRDDALIAVESSIEAFLHHHPSDRRIREVEQFRSDLELHRLERKYETRARRLQTIEGLPPVERAYFEAVQRLTAEPAVALARLQALVDLYREDTDNSQTVRDCVRLANKQIERLRQRVDRLADDDVQLAAQHLARAESLLDTDPEAARRRLAAIVMLYGDKPWTAPQVDRARLLLDGLSQQPAAASPTVPIRSQP